MSKASQRRLSEAQKRYETKKKNDPVFRAFAAFEESDPLDMMLRPASYYKKVMAALQPNRPHEDDAILDRFYRGSRGILEVIHESIEHGLSNESFVPGLVIQFGKNGVLSVSPRSPSFFEPPGPEVSFHEHLVAQEMKKSCHRDSAVAWFWIASATVPGQPMLVLAASRTGAGRLWMRIEDQWIHSPNTSFFGIIFEDAETSYSRTSHERAKLALDRALANGVMPRGSSWCDIPGTANAVSELIMDFATPYLSTAIALAVMHGDAKFEAQDEAQAAKDTQQRERRDLKAELATALQSLAAERLVSAGLRRDVSRAQEAPKAPPQGHVVTHPSRSISERMGVFFGQ
ncbi:hypothetical protein [Hydrogenophaga sp. 2FB]|uniref:hypothetical protein n=1 Tax=Hydrogenophaga sp. 2FB TaxID=2502187 RepID=UPI0010F56D0F|nr:hypothetical protein [Hydrogenophaga sp. 2FB]